MKMKPAILLSLLALAFVFYSCGNQSQEYKIPEALITSLQNEKLHEMNSKSTPESSPKAAPDTKPAAEPTPVPTPTPEPTPQPESEVIIIHGDSEQPQASNNSNPNAELDKRVREVALSLGENPNTFMLLIKDEGNYKVYRMIGMFVIVNNGETTYLPDEF